MAKNTTKKISITTFDNIMKEHFSPTTTIEWNGIEIIIKHTLSCKEMFEFVHNVTQSCFSNDTGEYIPQAKALVIRGEILEKYANFSLPSNIEHRCDLLYGTDAVDVVMKHINYRQFNEIMEAINDKIDNVAQANIETLNKQMHSLYNAFNNIQKQLSDLFAGVNPEDISTLLGAIVNDGIDEDKLVKAYLNNTQIETPSKEAE